MNLLQFIQVLLDTKIHMEKQMYRNTQENTEKEKLGSGGHIIKT